MTYDLAIIGAGPAGEGATHEARRLGLSVAVIDRLWYGGSCPHIGCVPSKSLLHGATVHHDNPAAYTWERASARRDYMVNRPPDAAEPDDSSHVRALSDAGADVVRGDARIVGPGRVAVEHEGSVRRVEAANVLVAVGSTTKIPPIEGLAGTPYWTNRQATLARELPRSLVVLGGGPTGCEMAQVFARFGVPTIVVQSGPRLAPQDHPRNSAAIEAALRGPGVDVRTGVRAVRVVRDGGDDGAHRIELGDGSTVDGHAILVAVGRVFPIADLGLEHYGIDASERDALPHDGRLRLADGLYVAGDPAGPELHTHQGHYQGELVARLVAGRDVSPDYRALPRATYTDPEAASVGLTLDQALEAGLDAFEETVDFAGTAKGFSVEAEFGHLTIVVDRASRELVGAAMACPDASAAIHECVVAIRARVGLDVLADTIHAFPSTSRALNGLFNAAWRRLEARG